MLLRTPPRGTGACASRPTGRPLARMAATLASSAPPAQSRAADQGDQQDSKALLALIAWCTRSDVKVSFAGCRPERKGGVRGVFATSDIAAGETLVAVPLSSSLSVRPDEPCPFPDLEGVWTGLPWYAQLAAKLLHERSLGAGSRFADYVAALPREPVDLPVVWGAQAVAALQYPVLQEQVSDEQAEWGRLCERMQRFLARRHQGRDDLAWALSCVRSRTFAGPYFPTPPTLKLAAGAAAATTVGAALAALGGGADLGAVAVGVPLLAGLGVPAAWQAAEARRAQAGEQGTVLYAVSPFLDMFNHSSASQSECVFAPWRAEFRVVAGQDVRRGQQLLINYGSQSNDALLQRYGFVEPTGNPHDRYVIPDLRPRLEAVLAAGGVPMEQAQRALRTLSVQPQALQEVAVTAEGAPAQTQQAVAALLAALPASQGRPLVPDALLAAACAAELAAAPTTLPADEEALVALTTWEAWKAAEPARLAAAAAAAAAAAEAAAEAAEAAAAAAEAAAGDAGAEAEGAEYAGPSTGAAVEAPQQGASDGMGTAMQEAVEEPPPLPPPELEVAGGNVERCRTLLQFRIAKKRVLSRAAARA